MDEWIDMRMRPPTAGDCDVYGCVLVWHIHNGVMVYEWRNAIGNQYIAAWMPPPEMPAWLEKSKVT